MTFVTSYVMPSLDVPDGGADAAIPVFFDGGGQGLPIMPYQNAEVTVNTDQYTLVFRDAQHAVLRSFDLVANAAAVVCAIPPNAAFVGAAPIASANYNSLAADADDFDFITLATSDTVAYSFDTAVGQVIIDVSMVLATDGGEGLTNFYIFVRQDDAGEPDFVAPPLYESPTPILDNEFVENFGEGFWLLTIPVNTISAATKYWVTIQAGAASPLLVVTTPDTTGDGVADGSYYIDPGPAAPNVGDIAIVGAVNVYGSGGTSMAVRLGRVCGGQAA